MKDLPDFTDRMRRVEALIHTIERSSDTGTREAAREVVTAILDLHRVALGRMLDCCSAEEASSRPWLDECLKDDLIRSMLLLHGLHPDSLECRVERALDEVRPYLASHGGNVELVAIDESQVRVRLNGSCHHCPSSTATLRGTVEQAIYRLAPDATSVELVEDAVDSSKNVGLVSLNLPDSQNTSVRNL